MDLKAVLTSVCALGCVCTGLLLLLGIGAMRLFGGPAIMVVWDTFSTILGGGRGGDDDAEAIKRKNADPRRISGTDSLRIRAQSLDFDDALRRQGGNVVSGQSAAPQARTTGPLTLPAGGAGSYQSQSGPTASRANLPPPPTFPAPGGNFQSQSAAPVPPRGNFQPLQGGYSAQPTPLQAQQPGVPPQANFTPLAGAPRRPTLSQGRALPPNITPTPSPSLRSGLEGEELPGLRGRRRRGEEETYADDEQAGFLDGLF